MGSRQHLGSGRASAAEAAMPAAHDDWLTAAAKRTHRTADTPEVAVEAVERAEMAPEYGELDDLLE